MGCPPFMLKNGKTWAPERRPDICTFPDYSGRMTWSMTWIPRHSTHLDVLKVTTVSLIDHPDVRRHLIVTSLTIDASRRSYRRTDRPTSLHAGERRISTSCQTIYPNLELTPVSPASSRAVDGALGKGREASSVGAKNAFPGGVDMRGALSGRPSARSSYDAPAGAGPESRTRARSKFVIEPCPRPRGCRHASISCAKRWAGEHSHRGSSGSEKRFLEHGIPPSFLLLRHRFMGTKVRYEVV